jgi:hypothetical protein
MMQPIWWLEGFLGLTYVMLLPHLLSSATLHIMGFSAKADPNVKNMLS